MDGIREDQFNLENFRSTFKNAFTFLTSCFSAKLDRCVLLVRLILKFTSDVTETIFDISARYVSINLEQFTTKTGKSTEMINGNFLRGCSDASV